MINSHKINRISRRLFEKVCRLTDLLLLAVPQPEADLGGGGEVKIVPLASRDVLAELIMFY